MHIVKGRRNHSLHLSITSQEYVITYFGTRFGFDLKSTVFELIVDLVKPRHEMWAPYIDYDAFNSVFNHQLHINRSQYSDMWIFTCTCLPHVKYEIPLIDLANRITYGNVGGPKSVYMQDIITISPKLIEQLTNKLESYTGLSRLNGRNFVLYCCLCSWIGEINAAHVFTMTCPDCKKQSVRIWDSAK